MVIDMDAGF